MSGRAGWWVYTSVFRSQRFLITKNELRKYFSEYSISDTDNLLVWCPDTNRVISVGCSISTVDTTLIKISFLLQECCSYRFQYIVYNGVVKVKQKSLQSHLFQIYPTNGSVWVIRSIRWIKTREQLIKPRLSVAIRAILWSTHVSKYSYTRTCLFC